MKNFFPVFILILAVCISGCQKKSAPKQTPVIKIGVICPLSGNLAFLGEDLRNGILLAQKEISPDTKFQYQVIFEDDGFEDKKTVSAAQKLINVDKVDCIITMFSNAGPLVAPIAEKHHIVHFGIAWDDQVAEGFYNFKHWPRIPAQVTVLVKKLSTLPYKKIGIIRAYQKSFVTFSEEFKKQLSQTPMEVVFEEAIPNEERNFNHILPKAKNSPAECFLVLLDSPGLDILMRKWSQWNIGKFIISADTFDYAQETQWLDGYFFVASAEPSEEFVKKFKKNYEAPLQLLAARGFDIFNILVSTYEKFPPSSKPSTHDIASALLAGENLTGAFGKLAIDSEGIISCPISIKEYKDGKKITLETHLP